jgi:tetratricopeptide (TPR) repeat protein
MYRVMLCAAAVLVAAQPATADDNGTCSSGTGDEAIDACSRLLMFDPNSFAYDNRSRLYYNRGNAYYRKGDYYRAISDFDLAIRLDPKSAWAYNNRGEVYEAKNDLDHAIADFDQALKLNPSLQDARQGRQRVQALLAKQSNPGAQANAPTSTAIPVAQTTAPASTVPAPVALSGHAEKRVALVVGNAAYRHADKLDNPVNDAQAVREALEKLGFDVIYGENLDLKGLGRAIGQFAGRVEDADVAIVYFAGHGATFGDTPYVVPVDAEFSNLGEVPYELIAVETLIGELRRAKGVRIAILDACRDNAAERSLKRARGEGTRGLGPVKDPDGLILAYATQYLSTAADGGNGHSPFTAALLHNIATPGLDVKDVFFNVGHDVVTATAGRQRPEISVSIYERYALVPTPPGGTGVPPASRPAPRAAGADTEQSQQSCTTQLEAAPERYTARVIRLPSEQEVLARTMRVEGREQARISPAYRALRRVEAQALPPNGSPAFSTLAAIPEYMTVKVGDMVELVSRHRDPTLPCNFIPWTINRIIAHEGTR